MQQSTSPQKDAFRLALVLVLIWIWMSFMFLGMRPWSSRGEPREAIVAQSMLRSGNYVLGAGYGGIVPSKPPVLHWSAVAISEVAGVGSTPEISEWSMRAPSAIAALLVLLLVFQLSRSLFPQISPLLAPMLLASSFEFFRSGIEARVDMILCAAMFGAVFALWRFLESPRVLNTIVAGSLLAVAILAKGPVGVVLPCGALVVFYWFERRKFIRPLLLVIPALVGLGLAGTWYWQAFQVGGFEFFERVKFENILRFLGTAKSQPHKHSALHLFGMLLVGLLPWVVLLIPHLTIHPRNWRTRITSWYVALPDGARLMVWWIAVVFVFFCIPTSKRAVYLLPMYPAVAVLLAASLSGSAPAWISKLLGAMFLIIGGAGVALELGFLRGIELSAQAGAALSALSQIASVMPSVWIAHFVLLGVGVVLLRQANRLKLTSLVVLYSLGLGGIHGGILPLGATWLSAKPFAEQLNREFITEPANELFSFDHEFYGLSFYLNRKITRIEVAQAPVGAVIVLHEGTRNKLDALGVYEYEFVARSVDGVDEPFNRALAVRVNEVKSTQK